MSFLLKSLLKPVTKKHVERKILQTHPLHLFDIIQNVDEYQHFLPLCTHSRITKRQSKRKFEATLTVGFPPLFQETYVSSVSVDPEKLSVSAVSIRSELFDSLRSRWILEPVKDKELRCKVDFEVEITASNPMIVETLDRVLQEVGVQQMEAFERRCKQVPMPPDLTKE